MRGSVFCRVGAGLVVALALLAFAGCSGNETTGPPQQQAPKLPSVSTMTMDFSFFDQTAPNPAGPPNDKDGPGSLVAVAERTNFVNAAARVYFLHFIFWEALNAPVAAFAAAVHSVPQHQPDDSWLWTYIFVDGDVEYDVVLYGTDAGDHTEWRMEVSTNNPSMPLDHFVWFDGEAMKDNSSVYWQFYEPIPTASVAASAAAQTPGKTSIRMEWEKLSDSSHQLTVLNNNPDSPDQGDEIVFSASPTMCSIVFTDASSPDAVYNITWYADGSGSIQVPDYNSGEKACWDTNQFDVVCPQ